MDEPSLFDLPTYMPTTSQQRYLSFGFIPSSLLSIFGSTLIIIHIRHEKRNTPYRNILFWLSIFDIVNSISWIFQPFLTPAEVRDAWVWSVGNDATCNVLGAMSQFGFSAHWYSGLLSFYFVLTARYGMQQKTFGKYLPYIHGFIFVWSVGTAIAGVALGAYGPIGVGPGCWVAGDHDCEEDCIHGTVGWIMGGFPSLSMLLCIIINNLLLYCHVRGTIAHGQRRGLEEEVKLSKYGNIGKNPDPNSMLAEAGSTWDDGQSIVSTGQQSSSTRLATNKNMKNVSPQPQRTDSSIQTTARSNSKWPSDISVTPSQRKTVLRSSDKQWKLVQEVGTQSFLYVGAYFLCFAWSLGVNALDSQQYEYEPGIGNVFLPLLILQSIFLPAQGFFNSAIFFRPKYAKTRQQHPNQSRLWCMRRSVFGNSVQPKTGHSHDATAAQSANVVTRPPPITLRINHAGEVAMSSLGRAVCSDDECSLIFEEDEEEDEASTKSRNSSSENTNSAPQKETRLISIRVSSTECL